VLRGVTEYGVPAAVANSGFFATIDEETCIGCEDCVERCPFTALSVPEDIAVVDLNRCVGCGVCTIVCPTESIQLERHPDADEAELPANIQDWMQRRAEARGLGEVL
jgi:heterodisulfide reductase subunit A-like polyferredoxin